MHRVPKLSAYLLPLASMLAIFGEVNARCAEISYARDVRPILAAKCFACHGPAEDSRQAELRLDNLAGATADLGGHQAIKAGNAEQSEAIYRIESSDPDERMPPPETNKTLAAAEIATLRQWINDGAKYEQHWAFTRPQRPNLPAVSDLNWTRNPIDSFVLARLDAEGLKPAPIAKPYILIRRLYLDLIGLPPSIAAADEWHSRLTADMPAGEVDEVAYRELVESLLASPHYGERWARKWLDLARYADTNGYEKDRPRSIWPYRDWVIRAMNEDLPFDQFTIKQIAGDMLPAPTQDDLIATGFHRNTMQNEEGGIDPLEFRFYSMTDRVATTGTTWLALTLGCTQCHSHKYDPITHHEYYQFMALMNNADEPELKLSAPEQETILNQQHANAAKLLAELPKQWPETTDPAKTLNAKFQRWLEEARTQTVKWTELRPFEATSNLPLLTVQDDNSIYASGDITKDDTYTLKFREVPAGVTAIRLEALPDDRLPAGGPGMTYYEGPRGDFFLGEFQVWAGSEPVKIERASESYAKNHFGKTPVSASLTLDGDPQTGWECAGRTGEAHQAVFVFATPEKREEASREWTIKLRFGRHYACSLGRFRLSVATDSRHITAHDRPRQIEELLVLKDGELNDAQKQVLLEHFLFQAPELKKQADQIRNLYKGPATLTTLILRERPDNNPRITHRHHRGEFLQVKELVTPNVPKFLPPLPSDVPQDRLALARWLVAPENPLTSRVIANRQWEAFFGSGIVATSGDFGFQGEFPSHPELLDWLATEFMNPERVADATQPASWSLKNLHRLIVTSATYRQSSRVTPALLVKDPQNRLLARAGRLRVDAELVRDIALEASGTLSKKMYGPPVRPPQPDGVLETAYGGGTWEVSQGEDRYRRGIYTFAKRTTPYAMFSTFDAPSGETCVARRDVSNSPLQSLTLLNDSVILEAAQTLGRHAAGLAGDDREKATFVFRRCLTRIPEEEELKSMIGFVNAQRERLAKKELDAKKIAAVAGEDLLEPAAWTTLVRAVLNLDELITRN